MFDTDRLESSAPHPASDVRVLDERDLALVDALQVNPRASWAHLAPVLDVAPITLARRWGRLAASGAAWVTVTLGQTRRTGALIEFRCAPGRAEEVALDLAERPDLITVGVTSGDYDVFALAFTATEATLPELLPHRMPLPAGVTEVRTHVMSRVLGGFRWRMGVMNHQQTDRVREPPRVDPGAIRSLGEQDRALFLALGRDGRRRHTDLARELGSTPQAIRRRLDRLGRRGDITFRCDVARPLAGWHAMALLWLSVPDADVLAVGTALSSLPETRLCALTASSHNVVLVVNLHCLEHLVELAERISRAHPCLRIADRRLVLRPVKVHGRIVDGLGRSVRAIPVDPWVGVPR